MSQISMLRASPGGAAGNAGNGSTGVFVSMSSLTFPVATGICTTLLKLFSLQFHGADTSVAWAFGVSLCIGAIIVFLGMPPGGSKKDTIGYLLVGLLNTLLLTASVLGIGSLTASTPVTLT